MITQMNIPLKDFIYLIRPAQWVKNLLIFAPPLFGGVLFTHHEVFLKMIQAFFAFSFASSAGYIINDLFDKEADSLHPQKKNRPITSERVTESQAYLLIFITLAISLGLSLKFGQYFILIIALYLILDVAYSYFLQHILIVDAFCIALGFVFRIEAGGVASKVQISIWLLLVTFLLSLLLAFGKRRFELASFDNSASHRKVLAKYTVNFLDTTLAIFSTTAIVAYSIYVVDRGLKGIIVTVPFVIYGVLRYMYLVQTNANGDPTDALLKDKGLFICVFLWVVVTAVIIHLNDILRFLK